MSMDGEGRRLYIREDRLGEEYAATERQCSTQGLFSLA